MSETNLSHPLPPASSLNRTEARDLSARIGTAIGAGTVRETPGIDIRLDNLRLAATAPSQAQRDAARQATPAATQPALQAPQRLTQAAKPPGASL